MKNLLTPTIVLIIASSVASFRRAGEGFTSAGTAFLEDHFSDEQLEKLEAEPKLSIKKVPADTIPESVNSDLVKAALAEAAETEGLEPDKTAKEKKTPSPTKVKADAAKA